MYLRRGRNVPCVDNALAGRPSTDILRRGMVKHDWTTRQTHPPLRHYSSNLPLGAPPGGLDYGLNLMVVLYRRANHTSIGYRIVLASSDRTELCYNIEEFLIFIDQVLYIIPDMIVIPEITSSYIHVP